MADTKISSLAAVTDVIATDEYVLARSGASKKITGASLRIAVGGDFGTSFPGSPATDDRFYRTDRDLLYFYDGTRWLTVTQYAMPLTTRTAIGTGLSATSTLANAPTQGSSGDMFVEDFQVVTFVPTTNNGTNFWTLTLEKLTPANAATTIGSVTTSADSVSTWTEHTDAVDEVVVGSTHAAFRIIATMTLSPGSLVCGIETTYRLVG